MNNKLLIVFCMIIPVFGLMLVLGKRATSQPACYVESASGQQIDLDHLCEPTSQSEESSRFDEQSLNEMHASGLSEEELLAVYDVALKDPDVAKERLRDMLCAQEPENECSISLKDIVIGVD